MFVYKWIHSILNAAIENTYDETIQVRLVILIQGIKSSIRIHEINNQLQNIAKNIFIRRMGGGGDMG